MGWTGIIFSAKFRLMRVQSTQMWQKTVRATNLEGLFHAFEAHHDWPYAAAWVDGTHAQHRGAVYFARHLDTQEGPLVFEEKKVTNISFYAPSWFLNPLSIRAHNFFYHRKSVNGERAVDLDHYFYPLDSLQNWTRFYGRRGLVQYQFCLPEENAPEGMQKALAMMRKCGETPFLTVLKRHGERPPEAIHSFPIKGYSLALDFPRSSGMLALVQQLDELVWEYGGKIYLTKDALSGPHMGRVDPNTFSEQKFYSLLRERIAR
jgi:FAD/FMN-containing dehydrogenase